MNFPVKHHLHRTHFADGSRQTLRAARARHDTDLDFGLSELRGFAGDDHVAVHHQFAAAAERESPTPPR
jgi:hypothetical protein